MARYIRQLVLWLMWLIMFSVSVTFLACIVLPALREDVPFAQYISPHMYASLPVYYAAMGVVVLCLLAVWAHIRVQRCVPALHYATAEGDVVIALHTLNRFITHVLRSTKGIARAQVRTKKDARKVTVWAHVKLDGTESVVSSVARAQSQVRTRTHAAFGLDILRDIHIEVNRVVDAPASTRSLLSCRSAYAYADTSDVTPRDTADASDTSETSSHSSRTPHKDHTYDEA